MNGTKPIADAAASEILSQRGRGALHVERSRAVRHGGPHGSDYADMSNEKQGENPCRRNSKVSWGRFVRPGLVGT
jgi:hypothetical protein